MDLGFEACMIIFWILKNETMVSKKGAGMNTL
jgi:hypothetical protein